MRTALPRRPAGRGFTLIELLVVIGIILLLMGLILPILAAMQERRRILYTKQEVQIIKAAINQYYEELQDYPPDTDDYGTGDNPEYPTAIDQFSIYKYLGKKITNVTTGKEHGPFFTVKLKYLNGPAGQEVYYDPWGRPLHIDTQHVQIDTTPGPNFGRVTVRGNPYPAGTPPEKQLVQVKVWSEGPDKDYDKGSNTIEGHGVDRDYDNITSWE